MNKKQQIIEIALDNSKSRTFSSLSLQSLAKQAEIKKASLFHHFSSKQELAELTLDYSCQLLVDYFIQAEQLSATKQLSHYLQLFEYFLEPTQKICPSIGFIADIDEYDDTVKQYLLKYQNQHIHYLDSILRKGANSQEFRVLEDDCRLNARSIYYLLQGALVSARLTGKKQDVFDCRQIVSRMIGCHL